MNICECGGTGRGRARAPCLAAGTSVLLLQPHTALPKDPSRSAVLGLQLVLGFLHWMAPAWVPWQLVINQCKMRGFATQLQNKGTLCMAHSCEHGGQGCDRGLHGHAQWDATNGTQSKKRLNEVGGSTLSHTALQVMFLMNTPSPKSQ